MPTQTGLFFLFRGMYIEITNIAFAAYNGDFTTIDVYMVNNALLHFIALTSTEKSQWDTVLSQ